MKKTAFTLIELLVVISIIALLLAILMPALGIVKKKAQGVVCTSNLRNLSMAWYAYAVENDDKLIGGTNSPTSEDLWSDGSPIAPWACSPQNENGTSLISGSEVVEEIIGIKRGLLYSYLGSPEIYHCAGDARSKSPPVESGWGGKGGYRSYSIPGGMNGLPHSGGFEIVPCIKLGQVKRTAGKYIFVEEMDGRGYNMGSWVIYPIIEQWIDPIAIWHNDSSTIGFADGHAISHKWLDQATIDMAEQQTFYQQAPGSKDLHYMQRGYAYLQLN